jgi:hypothetical protein
MNSLWTTFRYTITNLRWQIIGWGLGLALYGLMIVPMYETLGANPDQFQQMIANYPSEFLAFQQSNYTGGIPWDVCFLDATTHRWHLCGDGWKWINRQR